MRLFPPQRHPGGDCGDGEGERFDRGDRLVPNWRGQQQQGTLGGNCDRRGRHLGDGLHRGARTHFRQKSRGITSSAGALGGFATTIVSRVPRLKLALTLGIRLG